MTISIKRCLQTMGIFFVLFLFLPYPVRAESINIVDTDTAYTNTAYTNTVYTDTSGINSWWTYPLSVQYKGKANKTYTSYTTKDGYSGLIEKNNQTGKITRVNITYNGKDDHNAGAVEMLNDGRLLYATTGHCRDKFIKLYVSKNPENITAWDQPLLLPTKGKATYVQIIKTPKGFYLFTRLRNALDETADGRLHWTWAISFSENGRKWTPPRNIIDGGTKQYYLKAMACKDSDDIRLIVCSNPKANQSDMRLAFYNPFTRTVQDEDEQVLSTADNQTYGVFYSDIPIIVSKGTAHQRLLDVAYTNKDTTMIAYGKFTTSSNATYNYSIYSKKELTTYNLCKAGKAFYAKSNYIGGIAISENAPNILYISRNKGKMWYIEKWKLAGKKFKKVATIKKTSSKLLIRPFLTKYCTGKIHWSEGTYNENNYRKFNTEIKSK